MNSLYIKLLKSIIFVFTLSWLMVALFTRAETAHEIEELFDAQLAEEAGILFVTSVKALEKEILINNVLKKTASGHKYENKISFQIWDGEQLLFRSQNTPQDRLSKTEGYSDQYFHDKKWRVFVTTETHGSVVYTVITAEEYDIRNELIHYIVLQSLFPLLIALPLLFVLLHFAIKKSLHPLQAIVTSVTEKDAMDFSPIHSQSVPDEIMAVISALNKLMERLKVAFDKERRFTTNAAHELRTPIAAIQLQAQVAKRFMDDPQQLNNSLDNIIAGTQRSSHLVEQMLTLARLEPEAIRNQFSENNIADTIRESISVAVVTAMKKDIEIIFKSEKEQGCMLSYYPQGIMILMSNLLQNSIRYIACKGKIDIILKCDEQFCHIIVADNGPGIADSDLDNVLERYYRASTQEQKGCGLGLSIVKQIVDIHKGTIHISNNNGLIVNIKIPVSA